MPPSFASISPRQRLSDQVADALAAEIRAGRMVRGDKLPTESALSQQFAVSRTVVREALSRLKSIRLIDSRQGSGVYVRDVETPPLRFEPADSASRGAVVQLVELRRPLEAEVAALAATRATTVEIEAIGAAVRALDEAVAAGGDGVMEDVAFHRSIAQAAHNPYLLDTLDYLAPFVVGGIRVTRANEARRGDFTREARVEHHEIYDAIARRDVDGARKTARTHMDNAIRRIEEADPSFWIQEGADLARSLPVPDPAGRKGTTNRSPARKSARLSSG